MNLSHITMGFQALTSGLMNALLSLRANLEIQERNLVKETNSVLAKAAEAQSDATYASTKKESDNLESQGFGEVFSGVAQTAASGAGEYFANKANGDVELANNEVDRIQNQISAKEQELRQVGALGDAPANAELGAVRDPATINRELDDLRAQQNRARENVQHKERAVLDQRQRFQFMGQSVAGGIKGSAQIAASNAVSDKAKYDAQNVIFNYSQQVLSKLIDLLSQMAQSQDAARRDLGQTLSALTNANAYHA